MFARLVKTNLKAGQAAEFNQEFEQKVIPMLRQTKGFRDVITLTGADGTEAISLTLWDHKEDAEAYNKTTFPEVLKALSAVIEGAPRVKTYDVTSSSFDKVALHSTN